MHMMRTARAVCGACMAAALVAAPAALAFAGQEGGADGQAAGGLAASAAGGWRVSADLSAQDALDPANLADGVYRVPVKLTQAADIETETMPSVFLKPEALLYVAGNDRKLVVTLQAASIMGAEYSADGLLFYPDASYSVSGGIIAVSPGAVPSAQVLTCRADPADKYNHYPEEVMGAFPAQAATNGGYLAVSMGSSAMSSSLLCLKCDWSGLELQSSGAPEFPAAQPADKAVLDSEIAKARAVARIEGREAGFAELQREVTAAQGVSDDASATQASVDSEARRLHELADSYRKAELRELYDEASGVQLGTYTAATRAELSRQLTVAKTVLDDGDAADASIAEAHAALKRAYDGLVVADVDKAALGGKLDEAAALGQGEKSDRAFAALQGAIGSARAVYDDDGATQGQVNDAFVSLTNAVSAFKASPDASGEGGDEAGALEPGMLYRALGSWSREDDPSQPSMMADYLEPYVLVGEVDGRLEVRMTPTAAGDALITAMYAFSADGTSKVAADVVSEAGVSPRQYRIVVDSLDVPILIGADAAMGTSSPVLVKALLSVDEATAGKVDPALRQGARYQVPAALYEQGTYAAPGQEASPLSGLIAAQATVERSGDGYAVRIVAPASDGVSFRRLVYGADRAQADVERQDDGSTAFALFLPTLTDAVTVGLTLSEDGASTTRYADLVLRTAEVAAVGGVAPAPDGGSGSDGGDSDPSGDSGSSGSSTPADSSDAPGKGGAVDGGGSDGGQSGSGAAAEPSGAGDGGGTGTPAEAGASAQEMHRLYNPWTGEHFYTADIGERDDVMAAGWSYEGVGWVAPETSAVPVFRLYNSYAGEHHYTLDAGERDGLVAAGWTNEGIGWFSDESQTVPLHREYNPNEFANNHNYTADLEEHENLVALGWLDEGVAWYAAAYPHER